MSYDYYSWGEPTEITRIGAISKVLWGNNSLKTEKRKFFENVKWV